jgi:hypothetical protein
MTTKMASFRFASLALTGALALAAGVACNGSISVDPIGSPSGSGGGGGPNGSGADGGASPESPRTKVIPDQATSPYTAVVATTDVSILYPLPATGESAAFLRPTETGNHGTLLPSASVLKVLNNRDSLDRVVSAPSGYAEMALISVRLDPCSARGVAKGACKSEVRAIFQALYDNTGSGDAVTGTAARDGAIHVMYDVGDAELVTMMKEILTLKLANGDVGADKLGPHPILKTQGLGGAFAQGFRNIVLSHLGEDRIGRITVFDHNFDPDSDGWTFELFERDGAGLTQGGIAAVPDVQSQTVFGTAANVPLTDSSADSYGTETDVDTVFPLVAGGRPAPEPQLLALAPSYQAAIRVQDPTVHTSETTSCGNCHLAEGARRMGEASYGYTPKGGFTSPRSTDYEREIGSVTNLHAFGYLDRRVSIMQRTANESVVVANTMESKVK